MREIFYFYLDLEREIENEAPYYFSNLYSSTVTLLENRTGGILGF